MKIVNSFVLPLSAVVFLGFLATSSHAQNASSCGTNPHESPNCVPVVIPFGTSPVMGYCQDKSIMSGIGAIYYGSNSTSAYITCTDVGNEPDSSKGQETIIANQTCPFRSFVIGLKMNSNETIDQAECAIITNMPASGETSDGGRTRQEDWAKTIGSPVICPDGQYVVGFYQQINDNNDSYGITCDGFSSNDSN